MAERTEDEAPDTASLAPQLHPDRGRGHRNPEIPALSAPDFTVAIDRAWLPPASVSMLPSSSGTIPLPRQPVAAAKTSAYQAPG